MARFSDWFSALSVALLLLGCGATDAQPGAPSGAGELCGGIAGLLCQPVLACVIAGSPHPDQKGTCRATSDGGRAVCPQIYRPVCGTDGRTYSNGCVAKNGGAGVAHDGTCEAQDTPRPPLDPPMNGARGGNDILP